MATATLPMMPMAELDAAAAAAAERVSRELEDDGDRGAAAPKPANTRPTPKKPSRYDSLLRWAHSLLNRLRSWLLRLVDWAAEEFDPWMKWVIFDALFALATAHVARKVAAVRPLFEAFGWT
jgi:hypothetical protein